MAERLYVVGMMGAGKSVVGERLAELLGWAHLDTDAAIERDAGMTVAQVFASEGEPRFRQRESAVIAAGDDERALVVSTGGGVVLDARNRDVLTTTGTVVWLRARVDTLASRIGDIETRPVLASASDEDVHAALHRIDAERAPLYGLVADIVVDVDDLGPDDVARRIVAARSEGGR